MRLAAIACVVAGCGRLGFDGPRAAVDGALADDAISDVAIPDGAGSGALVQQTVVVAASGTLTLSLPSPSTPGTLLVATLATNNAITVPPGWTTAIEAVNTGGCTALIAYLANNSGGITAVDFAAVAGNPAVGQLAEWSGFAALDQTGTGASNNPQTMQSVQTSGTPAAAGELGIATFCEDVNMPSYLVASAWAQLGSYSNVSSSPSFIDLAHEDLPMAAVSATVQSSVGGKYEAAIATFR